MSREVSIWNALADSKRRQIVALLQGRPHTTGELASHFDVSRFAVMKHLKVLEEAGLITVRREGRTRWNVLNRELLDAMRSEFLVDALGQPGSILEQSLALWPGGNAAERGGQLASLTEEISLRATPDAVFGALTAGIDSWWPARHVNGSRMILEPYVNGRFYEAFDETGQGVLHAIVTFIKQDEEIRLRGSLQFGDGAGYGPVPDSTVRIVLAADGGVTRVTLSHYFGGDATAERLAATRRQWRDILVRHRQDQGSSGSSMVDGARHLHTAQSLQVGATDAALIDLREVNLG